MMAVVLTPMTVSSANPKEDLFWDKNAGTMEERFECAKNSELELIAFLRLMPKGAVGVNIVQAEDTPYSRK